MAVLVLIFTAASVYIFSILAIMLKRSEPLLMSSVTEGTRGLLINFLPFALMTIILAVTDCSICYVADAVLSLAYRRFTTEGFFDLIFRRYHNSPEYNGGNDPCISNLYCLRVYIQ